VKALLFRVFYRKRKEKKGGGRGCNTYSCPHIATTSISGGWRLHIRFPAQRDEGREEKREKPHCTHLLGEREREKKER